MLKRLVFLVADNLSNAQSGSSLSLASAATNEADSVNSGGAGSQRSVTLKLGKIFCHKVFTAI